MVQSIRFKPRGVMVCNRCLHLRSSLSRSRLAALVSGDAGIKVATFMIMLFTSEGGFCRAPVEVSG